MRHASAVILALVLAIIAVTFAEGDSLASSLEVEKSCDCLNGRCRCTENKREFDGIESSTDTDSSEEVSSESEYAESSDSEKNSPLWSDSDMKELKPDYGVIPKTSKTTPCSCSAWYGLCQHPEKTCVQMYELKVTALRKKIVATCGKHFMENQRICNKLHFEADVLQEHIATCQRAGVVCENHCQQMDMCNT